MTQEDMKTSQNLFHPDDKNISDNQNKSNTQNDLQSQIERKKRLPVNSSQPIESSLSEYYDKYAIEYIQINHRNHRRFKKMKIWFNDMARV